MSTSVDLSKMVGPMPLGAWLAVVGGGLGFAVYQRRQTDVAATSAGTTGTAVADTSGVPGVGVGGTPAGWIDTTAPTTVDTVVTDLDTYARQMKNYLIGQGYDAAVVDSAVSKYVSGSGGFSAQEYSLLTMGLTHEGAPPTNLPAPTFSPTPVTSGGTSQTTAKYVMKDGYYLLLPTGSHWQARGNKRFYITPQTYAALKRHGNPHFTTVLKSSVLFKLPYGGQV